jgi:hypothetical protein
MRQLVSWFCFARHFIEVRRPDEFYGGSRRVLAIVTMEFWLIITALRSGARSELICAMSLSYLL